jgi:hypothetical protein
VIEQMSPAVKLVLHRFIAALLEQEAASSQSVSLIWDSVEHWIMAADSPRALLLLRRCGNHLMDIGMPDEAARVLERAQGLTESASEKYLIGTERTRALLRAERSVEAVAVIDALLMLRSSISPSPSPLDDLSLMSLQARWDKNDEIPTLLQEALKSLEDHSTTAIQRVSAASWLITVADNLCDPVLGREIYERIEDQFDSASVPIDSRLWLGMVFHASFGDGLRALGYANQLIEYSRHSCPPNVAIRFLRNAAHVLRCNDTAERALAVVNTAFQESQKVNATRAMAMCAGTYASICMQVGDDKSARHWLELASRAHTPGDRTLLDMNLWSHRAELAIRIGDVQLASTAIQQCACAAATAHSARGSMRLEALGIQYRVMLGESITAPMLEKFSTAFEKAKTSSLQDYSAEAYVLALHSAGRSADASSLADTYLSHWRRDLSKPSVPLLRAVRVVDATKQQSSD